MMYCRFCDVRTRRANRLHVRSSMADSYKDWDRWIRNKVVRLLETRERASDRIADVETAAVAAQVAFLIPEAIARESLSGIESLSLDQAFGQAKRHGGVVGPLPGLEAKRSAADDVVNRLK